VGRHDEKMIESPLRSLIEFLQSLIRPFQGLTPSGNYIDIQGPFNGDTVVLSPPDNSFLVGGSINPRTMAGALVARLVDANGASVGTVTWLTVPQPATGPGLWQFKVSFTAGAVPNGQWLTVDVTAKDPAARISLGNSLSVRIPPLPSPSPPAKHGGKEKAAAGEDEGAAVEKVKAKK